MEQMKLLPKHQQEKHVSWLKKCMKTDFLTIVFSDECKASLDRFGVWVFQENSQPTWFRGKWGRHEVMFWASIVANKALGPLQVDDDIKRNVGNYCKHLDKTFSDWCQLQTIS